MLLRIEHHTGNTTELQHPEITRDELNNPEVISNETNQTEINLNEVNKNDIMHDSNTGNEFFPSDLSSDEMTQTENFQIEDQKHQNESFFVASPPPICSICYDAAADYSCHNCSYVMCTACVLATISSRLDERDTKLGCPNCQEIYPEEELVFILEDSELYERFENIKSINYVDQNPFAFWCPRPNCGGYGIRVVRNRSLRVACKKCQLDFCGVCGKKWFIGHEAVCFEDLSLKLWTIKNSGIFAKKTQRCPFCRIRIEKTLGCNHMVCAHCKKQFCWLCRSEYTSDHFSSVTGCPGMQYSSVNVWGTSKPVRFLTKSTAAIVGIGLGVGCLGLAIGVGAVGGVGFGVYQVCKVTKKKLN